MRNPAANVSAILLLAAFGAGATPALGQNVYRQGDVVVQRGVSQGMAGAGGSGGSGGGADGRGVAAVGDPGYVNRNPSYVTHVRSSTPPPLDPSRTIYEVDCTKPFMALGKGNLRCI